MKEAKTLEHLGIWRNVSRRTAVAARNKWRETAENVRDHDPARRKTAGQGLLELLIKKIPADDTQALFHTPMDQIKKEASGCPIMVAKHGYEFDVLKAVVSATPVGPSARLDLYQAHVKSWQEILSSCTFLVAPDGVTIHSNTIYSPEYQQLTPELSSLKDLHLLSGLIELGVCVSDVNESDRMIDDFHERAGKYIPQNLSTVASIQD